MAIKRSYSIGSKRGSRCLRCGEQLLPYAMKDNTVCTCHKCGQKMTVDRRGHTVILTVVERPDIRRRVPPEIKDAPLDVKMKLLSMQAENNSLKKKLEEKEAEVDKWVKRAAHWEKTADDLAKMIEEIRRKQDEQDKPEKMA